VRSDASHADIRAAYLKLVLLNHPDKNESHVGFEQQDENDPSNRTSRLNLAYETLKDPGRRRAYDDELRRLSSGKSFSKKTAINGVFDLSAFSPETDDGPFTLFCRCGSIFRATYDQLDQSNGDLILQCEGCSEQIRVLYDVEASVDPHKSSFVGSPANSVVP